MSEEEMNDALDSQHFYASNAYSWVTTTPQRDLVDLLKYMDSDKMSYTLWLVPKPWNTAYKISQYVPQVEGAKELAFFEFKDGKKVKKVAKVSELSKE